MNTVSIVFKLLWTQYEVVNVILYLPRYRLSQIEVKI